MEASKVESFSDSVFAVAMTLLIFQVQVPRPDAAASNPQLVNELRALWPYYIALSTSFFTLLIMWVNHHFMLKKVRKISRSFLFANGSLLFVVIIVPYSTAMVSQYLLSPAANTACALYAGIFVLINAGYNLVWHTASYKRRLLAPDVSDQTVKTIRFSNLAGLPVYIIAFGVAFVNAYVSLAICVLMWVYWAFIMKLD